MMRWSLLAILLALVACGESKKNEKKQAPIKDFQTKALEPESHGPVKVGSFSMQAANTTAGFLGDKQLEGKVWIGVTVFTHCPAVCPTICLAFKEIQEEFKDEPDFRMLSVTVDPARDTVEMLQKYVQPLLGDALLKRLLEKVPGLGDLLGQ